MAKLARFGHRAPEREGEFTFTVEVQDANTPPQVATREVVISVSEDMAIITKWEDLNERKEEGRKKFHLSGFLLRGKYPQRNIRLLLS